jgi:hypothetical protein
LLSGSNSFIGGKVTHETNENAYCSSDQNEYDDMGPFQLLGICSAKLIEKGR